MSGSRHKLIEPYRQEVNVVLVGLKRPSNLTGNDSERIAGCRNVQSCDAWHLMKHDISKN